MSDYVTTTNSNFPVKDVTHKPKRMQGDMIKMREAELGIISDNQSSNNEDEVLEVITLERAISYYKKMSADAKNGKLYVATAKWLEELLVTRTSKTEAARKAVMERENATDDNIESK